LDHIPAPNFGIAPRQLRKPESFQRSLPFSMLHSDSPVPERQSARLLIVDPQGRLLLFRYADGRMPPFWATPGGQLLPGETYEQAAVRELAEETGFDAPLGPLVRTREEVFAAGDIGTARWTERYFAIHAAGGDIDSSRWTEEERRTIVAAHWWSLAELRSTAEPVLPDWVPEALASLLAATEVSH